MKILNDVFPAHFSVAAASFEGDVRAHPPKDGTSYVATTRVIVALDDGFNQVLVVAADSPSGAQIIFQERVAEYDFNEIEFFGTTVSGKRFAFKKDTNCGCGSRLRSWNPYRTLTSSKDPLF